MEQVTRRDLFIHAYLNAGYEPEDAIIMADAVIALMDQSKVKETPVSKPQADWYSPLWYSPKTDGVLSKTQDDWIPAKADDVLYFVRKEKFNSTWPFIQYGADLSLIDGKVRIRSKGIGKPMVSIQAYGQTDANHTLDTVVFDVVTPNRGVWIHYNPDFIVGVDFEEGVLQRVNDGLMTLQDSVDSIQINKGDRLILEVKRHHRKVDVFLENHTTGKDCVLRFEDQDVQFAEYNTMDFVFSDDVITEIDIAYLDCGLLDTSCCPRYEFVKRIDCDWEEREYFKTDEFKKGHVILVDSPDYIAYREKVLV